MSEPRLEDSTDYNGLKGNKKKVVYAVVAMALAIGLLYAIIYDQNRHVSDEIPNHDSVNVPSFMGKK
jgi:hypothetical protein